MVKTTVIDQHRSKKCTKCKVLKRTNEFSFQYRPGSIKGGPNGKSKKTCKRCMSITNKAYNKKNQAKDKPRKRREYLRRERARGKNPKPKEGDMDAKDRAMLHRHLLAARKLVETAKAALKVAEDLCK